MLMMHRRFGFFVASLLFAVCAMWVGAAQAQVVTFQSLLGEMADREALSRWPSPEYQGLQFSSYDRASVKPGEEAWFANNDAGNFLRVDKRQGRDEHVMMDASGPGAVVRIWSANPRGTLRVYLDDQPMPVIEGPMETLLKAGGLAPEPIAGVRARGYNLFLPIPYARRCVITSDAGGFYYIVNYRSYQEGTLVQTLRAEQLYNESPAIREAAKRLEARPGEQTSGTVQRTVEAGSVLEHRFERGPRAIAMFGLNVAGEGIDYERVLRQLVVEMEFDGQVTVWAPAGDFFGTGIGLNPFDDWNRSVRADGSMRMHWVMPYRDSAQLRLRNLGEAAVEVRVVWRETLHVWDDRSMHFHTTWREERDLATRPMKDWTYADLRGQGVMVGDALTITNPVEAWWGEGDEKIYIDGAAFPQHFGTGTEDYYGYAWCSPEPFESAYHAQIRSDGYVYGNNYGTSTVARLRALDAIPFRTSLKFDMEVWHWSDTRISQSAVVYFYAKPGVIKSVKPDPASARRDVPRAPVLPPPLVIEGALEAESLRVVRTSAGLGYGAQGGFGPSLWSRGQHLWVRATKVGDFIELFVPGRGEERLMLYATRSWDYAIVAISVGGERVTELDLYNTASRDVASTGAIDLGVHQARDGGYVVRFEVVGRNEKSEGSGTFFGVDCIVLEKGL